MAATMPSTPSGELEQPRSMGGRIFKNSNSSSSKEKEEEIEANERRRQQSSTETTSTSSVLMHSQILELETTIQVLREKLALAKSLEEGNRRNLQEKHRKCEELIQSNDDLRCMHREVSKELAKLKRFISSQGVGISSMRSAAAVAADEDDDNDEDSHSYLASLLTEAKSEVLEKQLKIDSLKRKHLYMEKEVTRLLEEQRITSKKEMKMTEQFSLQLEYARSAAREKDEEIDELKMSIEALEADRKAFENQLDHMSDKSVSLIQELESEKKELRDELVQTREALKKTFEEAMSSMQREYDKREEKTRIEMREMKKAAFETSKKAYVYGRNFASLHYERDLENITHDVAKMFHVRETETERKSTNEQRVFKAKLKAQRGFLLQTREQLKLAKENNAKLSRELTKTYVEAGKEKERLEQTRIAELTKLKECISERRRDVETVQKEFNDLFAKKARNKEDNTLQKELGREHTLNVAALSDKLQKAEMDAEKFEMKMVAHAVEKSKHFEETINATALESERRTEEMLSLSDRIRSFIEEKKEVSALDVVVHNEEKTSRKLYRIFKDDSVDEEKENVTDFSWTPNESSRKKPKSRIVIPKRSPLSTMR
ncbi:ORF73 [Bathycoccus prasinos]|uniref:ORF73 n=1 Tax=Bathycoccus prasinos TaxID=41875 RepID=K8FF26_9CHLO|nr:ORF73 [Bathycoccus prasinos]CCO66771.1 ORF73 [Bathycoccus prasinos]|eukprot:XP_007511211.1 ORF73 [Bathycoccus prasinos]